MMGLRARRFERRVRDAIVHEFARDVGDDTDLIDFATLLADPPTIALGSPRASRATPSRKSERSDDVDLRPFLDDEKSAPDDGPPQRREKAGDGSRRRAQSARVAASRSGRNGSGRSSEASRKSYIPLDEL
jgi:hypothetical protein